MTRGRPPRQAIREARAIGEKLGAVIETSCSRGISADLMICCTHATLFVKVKRSRSIISDILEIAAKYTHELLLLRTVPATMVILRELRIRSPKGTWQYYRILKDGIMEIRNRGDFDRSTADFEQSFTPPDPDTVFNQDQEKRPVSPNGGGFTCPFFEHMKGNLRP